MLMVNNDTASALSVPRRETRRHMLDLEEEVRQLQADMSNERRRANGQHEDYQRMCEVARHSVQLCGRIREQHQCCMRELETLRKQHTADTRVLSSMLLQAMHERADILAMAKSVLEHSDNASLSSCALPLEKEMELVRLTDDALSEEQASPRYPDAQSPVQPVPEPPCMMVAHSVPRIRPIDQAQMLERSKRASDTIHRSLTNDSIVEHGSSRASWELQPTPQFVTPNDNGGSPLHRSQDSTNGANSTSGHERGSGGAGATEIAGHHGPPRRLDVYGSDWRPDAVTVVRGVPSTNAHGSCAERDTVDHATQITNNSTVPARHATSSSGAFLDVRPPFVFEDDQSAATQSHNKGTPRQSCGTQETPPSTPRTHSDRQSMRGLESSATIFEDATQRTAGCDVADNVDNGGAAERPSTTTVFGLDSVHSENATLLPDSVFSADRITESTLTDQQHADSASSVRFNTVNFDPDNNTKSHSCSMTSVGDPNPASVRHVSSTSCPPVSSDRTVSSLNSFAETLVSCCLKAVTEKIICMSMPSLASGTLEDTVAAVVQQVMNASATSANATGSIDRGVGQHSVKGTQTDSTTEVEGKEHHTRPTALRDVTSANVERLRDSIDGTDRNQVVVDQNLSLCVQHERPSARVGDDVHCASTTLTAHATKTHVRGDPGMSHVHTIDTLTCTRRPHSNDGGSSVDPRDSARNQLDECMTPLTARGEPAIVHAISELQMKELFDTRRLHPCSPVDSSTPSTPAEVTSSSNTVGALRGLSSIGQDIARVSDTRVGAGDAVDNARVGDNVPLLPHFKRAPDLRDVGRGPGGRGNIDEVFPSTMPLHSQHINDQTALVTSSPKARSSNMQPVHERASTSAHAKLPLDPQPATQSKPFTNSRATWPNQELVLPTLSRMQRERSVVVQPLLAAVNPTHEHTTSLDFVPPASSSSFKYDSVKHPGRGMMSRATTGSSGLDRHSSMASVAVNDWRPLASDATAMEAVNPPSLGGAS